MYNALNASTITRQGIEMFYEPEVRILAIRTQGTTGAPGSGVFGTFSSMFITVLGPSCSTVTPSGGSGRASIGGSKN